MATRQEIEQALVTASQRYKAAKTQEEKDLIRQKAQVLVKSLESQPSPADVPQLDVDALQEKGKTDPQGVAMSIIAGLNRGAVAIADLPSDLVNLAVGTVLNPAPEVKRLMESVPFFVVPNALLDLVNKIPQDVKDNYLKVARPSEVVGRNVERVTGFDPIQAAITPLDYAQDTGIERMLGTAGEYAGGGFAVGAAAPRVAQSLLRTSTGAPTPTPRIGEQIAARPNQFLAQEAGYSAAAGVGGGVAREQFPEFPMAELPAALLSGVGIPMAAGGIGAFKIPFFESLSKQAVERRVGTSLIDSTADVETAIANLTTNRKVMERAVGEGTEVNAVQLTQDPTLITAVEQVARTDNSLLSILGRIKDNTEERLISIFQDIAPVPKTEAGKSVVGAVETVETRRVAAGNELLLRLQDEIDLAKNTIDKLEAKFGGADDPTISVEFVDALKTSYNRAKQVERDLWSSVDKTVKLEPKALITSLNQLRKVERDKPYAAGTIPEDLFKTAKKLRKKPTFENLTVYRSALTDARRNTTNTQTQAILDKMVKEVDNFLDDFDLSEEYMVARNYTRALHEEYDQGKLGKYLSPTRQGNLSVDPQVALSRIVRAGDNVGDVERSIIAEQGGTLPPAEGLTPKIMEYLRSKFSQQSIVQGRGRDAFFKKYEAVLKRFPELARDLGSINAELKALSQSIAQKEGRAATVLDENRTAVSALLGAEPDNLLPTLAKLSKDDLELVATVMKQEGVLNGLQSVYIDEFTKRLIRTNQRGNIVFKDNNVENIIRESIPLQRGWDKVLSPRQKIAIRRVEKARALYAKVQESGSAEEILSTLQADPVTVIISRSLGIKAAGEVISGGAGSLQAASAFSNFTKSIINRLTREQSIAVLRKAITDPDYLEKLLIASKAAEVSGNVETVNAYLFAAGIQNVEGQNRENR